MSVMEGTNLVTKQEEENKSHILEEGCKLLFLFLFGGMVYYFMEILFRDYSHVSMIICGGLSFVLIGALNEGDRDYSVLSQMVIGAGIITTLEFITGVIVNLILHLNVWDYSLEPYNLLGQVCLAYSNLWFLLSFLCIVLDDFIRSFVFGEPKVTYRWL